MLNILVDADDHDALTEEWVLEMVPELQTLEPETLTGLLAQFNRHLRYEEEAHHLVRSAVASVEHKHRLEVQRVRLDADRDTARIKAGVEAKHEHDVVAANREISSIEQEANQALDEAQNITTELEERVEQHKEEARCAAEAAEERYDLAIATMQEKYELAEVAAHHKYSALQKRFNEHNELLREAQTETELKRETASKLKTEVIDNDRLTVANLNRIKLLEAELNDESALVAAFERENGELKSELRRDDQSERLAAMEELLQEREGMVEDLQQKLADTKDKLADTMSPTLSRRDSLLDRFGLKGSESDKSSALMRDLAKEPWKSPGLEGLRDNWNGIKDNWKGSSVAF